MTSLNPSRPWASTTDGLATLLVGERRQPTGRGGRAAVHRIGEDGEEGDGLAHPPQEAVDRHRQRIAGRRRPGRRVTGHPDVEGVGRLTGLVRPAQRHRSPPLGRIGGSEADQVEPGMNPVFGLENGEPHPGGPAPCTLESEGHRPHHSPCRRPARRRPRTARPDHARSPCRGGAHQGVDIRVRWPRPPSPPADPAAVSLVPARQPSTDRSTCHPSGHRACGWPPASAPIRQISTGRTDEELFFGLGQSGPETLSRRRRRRDS